MHQGEQAYRGPQSPTQTLARPQLSPTTTTAHPLHYPPPLHQHHRPPPSPTTAADLPPISTALYSRDQPASKYYDPTSDYGDRAIGRDSARYDPAYPPQVRTTPCHATPTPLPHSTLAVFHPTLVLADDAGIL